MRNRVLPVALCAAVLLGMFAVPAGAVNVAHDQVVSADPADWTPWVNNGRVYALVQIGTTMYVGGTFTQVQAPNASTYPRRYLFAFDLTTGAVSKSFKPALDGEVNTLATDGTSLFVGGAFTTVNGASRRGLVALDANGAVVPGFAAEVTAGTEVDDLVAANDQLYVAGAFTQISGSGHAGLASVDLTTGAVIPGVSVNFTGLHNNGVSHVAKIDVSPDGGTLVAIGNFTTVSSMPREQMAMLALTPTTASVTSWSTSRFVMQCSGKFDTYLRDIDIDPTGTYVVVATTGAFFGGVNANTLCDSVSRWELGRTGSSQQPTWVDYAGGDTTWSVTATGAAVYTGGHYRWYNNPYAGDHVGPGTIKRKAIAALDPINGMPLAWNPGRSPGEGVFIMISTPEGLWVGDDTNKIAGEYHPRLAFFPLAGGTTVPVATTATLPGTLYSLPPDSCASVDPSILYRINAGGPSLPSLDCGPDWADDTASSSVYRTSGSATASYGPVTSVDPTRPADDAGRGVQHRAMGPERRQRDAVELPGARGAARARPAVPVRPLLLHLGCGQAGVRRHPRGRDRAGQLGPERRGRSQRRHDALVRHHLGRHGQHRVHPPGRQPDDRRDRADRPRRDPGLADAGALVRGAELRWLDRRCTDATQLLDRLVAGPRRSSTPTARSSTGGTTARCIAGRSTGHRSARPGSSPTTGCRRRSSRSQR